MLTKDEIEKLLNKMGNDKDQNIKLIAKEFGSIDYKDSENQTLLHIFVDNKYNQYRCFAAIRSLLEAGLDPNAESEYGYNFIQTALYTGYGEEFILKIIKESFPKSLDTNHVDEDGDTMMHTAIYSDYYKGRIDRIYQLLVEYGLDSTIRDNEGRNLLEAMKYQNTYNIEQISRFSNLFALNLTKQRRAEKEYKKIVIEDKKITKVEKPNLERYGSILNNKEYKLEPAVGRGQELKNLMITLAQEKKMPIITGESGVGKTALVEELAYKIQRGNVPNFLKNKIILEVNPAELIAGCTHVGEFENKLKKLINACDDGKTILFIDEIHTMYGTGTHDKSDNDMASMLKYYIDRTDIKIIGTTTNEEYEKYFSNDVLKRRFERVDIKEPTKEVLYKILDNTIEGYVKNGDIKFDNNMRKKIIQIIIDATTKKSRVYNDKLNNPDLSISIVDRAFAIAKVFDEDEITKENFIESFKTCNRIYESTRDTAINKLKQLNPKVLDLPKIIKLEFRDRK